MLLAYWEAYSTFIGVSHRGVCVEQATICELTSFVPLGKLDIFN